jgi:hypothetical protein
MLLVTTAESNEIYLNLYTTLICLITKVSSSPMLITFHNFSHHQTFKWIYPPLFVSLFLFVLKFVLHIFLLTFFECD